MAIHPNDWPRASDRDFLAGMLESTAQAQREIDEAMGSRRIDRPTDPDFVIEWVESELGMRLRSVPKVLAIFLRALRAFIDKTMLRLVILGPRGGGKTRLAAALEVVAYRWYGYEAQNVGGSLQQARRCFEYIRDAHYRSADLAAHTAELQATRVRSRRGDDILISAASMTSVRGPHPVGSSGGGMMLLDEAALIPDEIIDASKGQMVSARPSAIVQTSTMGESPTGRFYELVGDPASRGYELSAYDVFDVAQRCPYDCATTCPVKEHFAQDYYEGGGAARVMIHSAYCGGKAHDVDGWIPINEIAQQFRELDREKFEREMMGKAVHRIGRVYDPTLIDLRTLRGKALSKDPAQHAHRFQRLIKAVGVDWGYAGQTAVVYVCKLQDALVAYRWEFWTGERYGPIREHVINFCLDENVETIYPDSANPSDNEEMHNLASTMAAARGLDWAPRVVPIVFSKWKEYGIGEVRRRLEKGQLFFAPDFGGARPDPNFDRAIKYLKAYHTDQNGKPVKIDDHAPDALLCAVVGFAQSFQGIPDPAGFRR